MHKLASLFVNFIFVITRVKHVNDIDAKVSLQPQNVGVSTMQNLQYVWIGENLIQNPQFWTKCQGINNVILFPGRNLKMLQVGVRAMAKTSHSK